ncbi:hypothetical protein [Peredibacter starrii]|uniref:Uncharacterized protein n=1 Tax=Peredibacter starrii TaxID=28202 RepID=A0AAX4HMB5_9BACT|nr:hypothetical protein [Peredibacter starrii]WPU64405.1 hypothetical protein SOO65_17060 [Peredibacter starrii]
MKKLLSLSASKIYMVCGLGLLMTLGAFWHHQTNQTQLDRMNVLNQGVGTCFNRISQTFTAMMIKDIQSPYLNREFMALSDECLNETIKGINPFRKNVGKGYETLNQLISEVHWFHEKVLKIHSPMLAGQMMDTPLAPLSERYGKMENFKVNLVDEIDATNAQIREVQMNDEVLMGVGLIIFVLSLSLLSLQEFNRHQLQREIEREALNLLKAGQANVGAMVDRLVDRALLTQNMPVTAQIFKDYHGDLLERMTSKMPVADAAVVEAQEEKVEETPALPTHKTSLKEVLVSIQNIQPKELIHATDVRDVQLAVPYESFEQVMNAAINQLSARRLEDKKIMISNQIHSDRTVISLFLAGSIYTASELEFVSNPGAAVDGIDMNMIILKEMVNESGANWHVENKTDRNGNIVGMNIRLIVNRIPANQRSNKLVSVFKGKKKDLTRELMN